MVNTLSHIGIGLLLSSVLGLKGKKRLVLVLLSVLPDLDYFSYSMFTFISHSLSHEARNQLFYLFGHREFTHSIFFAFFVALLIWLKTKDRRFTFGGFQAVFLHVLIDYTTSAKMRPFYPLSTDESALRAVYPFDPVVNILPLLPLFIVTTEYLKKKDFRNIENRGKRSTKSSRDRQSIKNSEILSIKSTNGRSIKSRDMWRRKLSKLNLFSLLSGSGEFSRSSEFSISGEFTGSSGSRISSGFNGSNGFSGSSGFSRSSKPNGLSELNGLNAFVKRNERKLYASLLLALLVWITILPIAKVFLIDEISDKEGIRINYKNTYPVSSGKFLAVYSYNDTHYKLLEVSYWSGVEKSFYVEKMSMTGNIPDASIFVERAGKLYSNSVPQAIDYPVYAVSEKDGLVTVILSDARNPYVDKWPYFDTVYRFVFDRKSGEYEAYESHYGRAEKKLEKNYFE